MLTQYGDQQIAKTTTTIHNIRARWISLRLAETVGGWLIRLLSVFLAFSFLQWLSLTVGVDFIWIWNARFVASFVDKRSSNGIEHTTCFSITSLSLQIVIVSLPPEDVSPMFVNVAGVSFLFRLLPPVITLTTALKWIFLRFMTLLFLLLTSRRIIRLQISITKSGQPKQHEIMKMA